MEIRTKKVTLGTKENRFLKFMLITIIHKIDSFIRTYTSTPWKKNEDIINKLNTMKRAINNKLKTSFLKYVVSDYRNTSMSLVFNDILEGEPPIFISWSYIP
ncbi:DUF2357 domain-containing protein [Clostridium estertheticum]|uniref:DUF2357 domain-containing protein n=1 Tax=Clostridium estertheticum TaxID=238834 RepID=UPI001CF52739|nr:DUF2357 domain-containing protein [Clostridium estertheticum]MCB2340304.1 DUF2357 domain-containing protein [Clostridium estertheticum]